MHQQINNLRKMATSGDWTSSKWAKEPQGKKMAQNLFMPSFWNNVVFALKVSGPLVKVLRLVDTEKKPPMEYIYYEAIDREKECIASSFDHKKRNIRKSSKSLTKSEMSIYIGLYMLLLLQVQKDHEVMNGFFECMQRLVTDVAVQDLITNEMSIYTKAESLFGKPIAIRQRNTRASCNIYRLKELEQNLNDLVFVKYHRTLRSRNDMCNIPDPISLQNVDESNE
ncbi:hypothetical protein ACSBR2_041542 [Camellia fascicularis]